MKKIALVLVCILMLPLVLTLTGCGLPAAAFTADNTNGGAPLMVNFTNTTQGVKPDSKIVFDWDFGDGTKKTATKISDSVNHEYTKTGTYTVTMTAYSSDAPDKTTTLTQTVTVTHGALTKLEITPETVELNIGNVQKFTSQAFDDYGNPIPEAVLNWENGDAGTVTTDGSFTAGKIAGNYPQGITGTAELSGSTITNYPIITILPDPLDTATLQTLDIAAGATKQLTAVAKDQYGNVIDGLQTTWSMEDDKAGSITSDGMFTASQKAVSYENAVKVTIKQGDKTAEAVGSVTIEAGPLAQVGIAPTSINLGKGMTQQYVAEGADKYGNVINNTSFVWSCDSKAGKIDKDGLFTAGNIPSNYKTGISVSASSSGSSAQVSTGVNIENDKIVFYSNLADESQSNSKLYVMNSDGTGVEELKLGYGGSIEWRVDCSRDGHRLIYTDVNGSSSTTYISDTDGKWTTTLISDTDAYEASLSPDGTKVVYQSWKTGHADIYVMDIDGGNVINLTNDAAYDDYPSWSPDGTKIAFQSSRGSTTYTNYHIFTINVDGTGLKQLTTGYYVDELPQWSPDGHSILFQSDRTSFSYWGLYIMNSDGSNIHDVATSTKYNCSIGRWSPDGTKIVFCSDKNDNEFDIYTVNADGSNMVGITNSTARDISPNWLYPKKGVKVDTSSIVLNEDFGAPTFTAQDISNSSKNAVVRIETTTKSGSSRGSGFIIKSDGLILTANHVISDPETITKINVKTAGGDVYTAQVVAKDMVHDLALIKIEGNNLPTIEIGSLNSVENGQQVVVMGYPLGNDSVSITSGLVSTIEYDDGLNTTWIQTDSAINPGNSGGPLFDMHGKVIGIVTSKIFGVGIEGIGYAISANTINLYLSDLLAEAKITLN